MPKKNKPTVVKDGVDFEQYKTIGPKEVEVDDVATHQMEADFEPYAHDETAINSNKSSDKQQEEDYEKNNNPNNSYSKDARKKNQFK